MVALTLDELRARMATVDLPIATERLEMVRKLLADALTPVRRMDARRLATLEPAVRFDADPVDRRHPFRVEDRRDLLVIPHGGRQGAGSLDGGRRRPEPIARVGPRDFDLGHRPPPASAAIATPPGDPAPAHARAPDLPPKDPRARSVEPPRIAAPSPPEGQRRLTRDQPRAVTPDARAARPAPAREPARPCSRPTPGSCPESRCRPPNWAERPAAARTPSALSR